MEIGIVHYLNRFSFAIRNRIHFMLRNHRSHAIVKIEETDVSAKL